MDFRKITIYEGGTMAQTLNLSKRWLTWKNLPLTPGIVEEVQADILKRLSGNGSHIFSKGISSEFDLPIDSNVVLVAFTSSPDEVFAGFRLAESLGVIASPPDTPSEPITKTRKSNGLEPSPPIANGWATP